jgi:hypothetical protein
MPRQRRLKRRMGAIGLEDSNMKAHWQKRQGLVAAAAIACAAAMPANADTFTQWAPVVRATPVYVHVSDPRH